MFCLCLTKSPCFCPIIGLIFEVGESASSNLLAFRQPSRAKNFIKCLCNDKSFIFSAVKKHMFQAMKYTNVLLFLFHSFQ